MNKGLSHLSDVDLIQALTRLVRSGRDGGALLITHLGEMDDRRLALGLGFPSLFVYCTEVLHLSEHEAYHRILAARAAKRFPRVLAMVGDGSLNLTTVRLLAGHLTTTIRPNCSPRRPTRRGGRSRCWWPRAFRVQTRRR